MSWEFPEGGSVRRLFFEMEDELRLHGLAEQGVAVSVIRGVKEAEEANALFFFKRKGLSMCRDYRLSSLDAMPRDMVNWVAREAVLNWLYETGQWTGHWGSRL